jgi:hypothetical protein
MYETVPNLCLGLSGQFFGQNFTCNSTRLWIRAVPGFRSASRSPGSGARRDVRGAPRQKIAGPGGSEGPRIPPQRSLSLWAISQTPRARKDAHTCRWAWTEKRAVLGVSRRGDQCILFALPVRARQVAEPDLEGRSTGRSDTSFAAADARYGRGRPGDARGACLGGATDASRLFSRRKTMVG